MVNPNLTVPSTCATLTATKGFTTLQNQSEARQPAGFSVL